MPDRNKGSNERRGLASASEETKERVSRMGGEASHKNDDKAGGEAPHRVRGLQAADEAIRERVARAGGEASHGGHGKSSSDTKKSSSSSRGRD